jgi:hypothetical protein
VTAHGPLVGGIISYYALLGREPPESTAEFLGGRGVLLSGTSQLASLRCEIGRSCRILMPK